MICFSLRFWIVWKTVILFYFQGLVWLNVLVSTNDGKSNSEKTTSPIQYLQIESNHEGYRCCKKKLQFLLYFYIFSEHDLYCFQWACTKLHSAVLWGPWHRGISQVRSTLLSAIIIWAKVYQRKNPHLCTVSQKLCLNLWTAVSINNPDCVVPCHRESSLHFFLQSDLPAENRRHVSLLNSTKNLRKITSQSKQLPYTYSLC